MTPRRALLLAAALLTAAPALGACSKAPSGETAAGPAAPELPGRADAWVNGAPVTFAALRGSVVLVEAWHPT